MKSNNNKLLKTATEKPAVPLTTVTGFMKNVNNITSEDQVTTILHMRLMDAKHRVEFEKWLAGILKASQEWKKNAWSGRIVLRPPKKDVDYVVLFRFKTHKLMEGWLCSPERRLWLNKLSKLNIVETIDKDLQEGNVVFLPQGMVNAAWSSLSGQENIISPTITKTIKRSPPPPKWRSAMIVWVSLQMTVIPWTLFVHPTLHEYSGLPPYINLLITLTIIVAVVKWLLIPTLDRLCKCFLFGKTFPAMEPCLSCQKGCPCCRPSSTKTKNIDVYAEKLEILERQLQNTRRINGVGRRRLLERIETIEAATFIDNHVGQTKEKDTVDEVAIEILSLPGKVVINETNALLSKQYQNEKNDMMMESANSTGDIAMTVSIGYNVKPECEVQFEEWLHEISRTAATRVEGHQGALLIKIPPSTRGKNNHQTFFTHVIVFQFDTDEHLQEWAKHPARHELVDRLGPLLADKSLTEVRVARYDRFSDLFNPLHGSLLPSA